MFKSATFKLTLWYLAIVMTISLIFSSLLYNITTNELHKGLHSESERIYTEYPVFQNDPRFQPDHDIDSGSRRILLKLAGFNIIVLIGAGAASYWLARRTLRPIEAAHEQQKRFTADVSHELRTPLTALRMESEVALLNDGTSSRELRDTLASNLEEVAKMENLINNLLKLTKLEAAELQQSFKPVKVSDIVEDALKQIEPQAKQRDIMLTCNADQQKVMGDQASLTQLIVILLDNAVKYSPANSKVSLTSQLRDGAVEVIIEDHGKGISREALEHVFDRFYRADPSRSRQSEAGHGLGLSIAKMIADLHHGSITLTSEVDKGTTATVILPASGR